MANAVSSLLFTFNVELKLNSHGSHFSDFSVEPVNFRPKTLMGMLRSLDPE